jgi:hypothetical protein
MQNWVLDLDYNFYKSASYLDNHRLMANIYENIHGLASLLKINHLLYRRNKESGIVEQLGKRSVANHPSIKRWLGFESMYFCYIAIHLAEWEKRGYEIDINMKNINMIFESYNCIRIYVRDRLTLFILPHWINDDLIKTHRKILYNKDPVFYKNFNVRS